MPGFEIIAVDPNCYYSTDEDDDIDVEAEFDDEEECHEIIQEKCKKLIFFVRKERHSIGSFTHYRSNGAYIHSNSNNKW